MGDSMIQSKAVVAHGIADSDAGSLFPSSVTLRVLELRARHPVQREAHSPCSAQPPP